MPRGGSRIGAGRHSIDGIPMRTHLVNLNKPTVVWLLALGGGNLSAGIRKAASTHAPRSNNSRHTRSPSA